MEGDGDRLKPMEGDGDVVPRKKTKGNINSTLVKHKPRWVKGNRKFVYK